MNEEIKKAVRNTAEHCGDAAVWMFLSGIPTAIASIGAYLAVGFGLVKAEWLAFGLALASLGMFIIGFLLAVCWRIMYWTVSDREEVQYEE